MMFDYRPEERRAAHLVQQLLAGLAFVHSRSLRHRDVISPYAKVS